MPLYLVTSSLIHHHSFMMLNPHSFITHFLLQMLLHLHAGSPALASSTRDAFLKRVLVPAGGLTATMSGTSMSDPYGTSLHGWFQRFALMFDYRLHSGSTAKGLQGTVEASATS